jgi:O-antigen ligase
MTLPKKLFCFFIVISFLLPISINFGDTGNKPIDIVFSDFLLLFFIYFILKIDKKDLYSPLSFFVFINFFYAGILSFYFFIISGGNYISIISYLKLYKIFLFFFIGMSVASTPYLRTYFIKNIYKFSAFIVLIIFFSTLFDSRFPMLRWGESFFDIETYGFPNSFTTFLSILIVLMLYRYLTQKDYRYLILYYLGLPIVIFSLSRSSLIVLCCSSIFLFYFYTINKISQRIKLLFSFILIAIVFFCLLNQLSDDNEISKIVDVSYERLSRTLGQREDFSSGRTEMWGRTFELIFDKPVFGYCFQPFSSHNFGYDTPHNQYLELLYKTGIIGLILFSGFFLLIIKLINKMEYSLKYLYFSLLIGLFIGSFTQPNFTFSLTGNFLFFLSGFFLIDAKNEKYETIITES